MVVSGRSYGAPCAMVKRGPQLVQLVNGYRYLLSLVSNSSRSQSAQVARSGGMETRRSSAEPLRAMENPAGALPSSGRTSNASILAAGGGERRSSASKASSTSGAAKASIDTPAASLRTLPRTASAQAMR
jgi:hypothetical protein